MRKTLTLLMILAACSLATAEQLRPPLRALKDGAQALVPQQTEETRQERPRNPLDQGGEDCWDATLISSLPFCDTGSTSFYSDDYFEECTATFESPDVVYLYSPPFDQVVSISLLGSSYNTQLTLYETDSGCDGYWYYECSDDYSGNQSCIEGVTLYDGYTYIIVVDGVDGESGDYLLNVVHGYNCPSTDCGGSGSGETCDDPLTISALPYCDTRNTLSYQDDYFPECNSFACGERDVVYEYVPTANRFLGISVTSTEFQPHVEVWESWTDCEGRYLHACATVHEFGNSCITGVNVNVGFRYYILVDGHECGGNGTYTLNVYEGGGCYYPPCEGGGGSGETCEDAIDILSLPYTYSASTAGYADNYNFCGFETGAPDIVFSYTPTHTHLADILTCGGTQFESNLYIFRDGNPWPFVNCGSRPCYTFYNGFYWNAAMYCVEFEVGHSYCIVLDGAWSNSFGPFLLEMYETVVEACDINQICAAPNVETEPNNSCGQFDVRTLTGGDTLAGNICEPGDADYFLVTVPEDVWHIAWVNAGPECSPGAFDLGNTFVYPDGCAETSPCAGCGWIIGCGPETQGIRVGGLGDCYTGPYQIVIDVQPAPTDDCDPIACQTAPPIECNVPTLVNTCDGCQSPLCRTYRDGCAGDRGYTGPQKFFELVVPAAASYTVTAAAVDTTSDVQFSIFTDCVLPRTTCVFSQDQNYWLQNPTGPRWTETGSVALDPGTYYLHVSLANSACGDVNLLVECEATQPCLPPDSVTIRWTTASTAEIRFVSDGGTYEIYSTTVSNNDGDPRGGDPQWSLRHTANFPAGQALWTDSNVADGYRNYVVLKTCP